jgi:HEAT repeat protein
MWEFALYLLAGGAALLWGVNRDRLQAWRTAATSCGLQVVEAYSFGRPQLKARAGMVEVKFEAIGNQAQSTRVVVLVPGPPDFAEVAIRPHPRFSRGQEIGIGDAAFDNEFFIEGPMPLVLALLDAEMRRLLLEVGAKSRLEISFGGLQAESNPLILSFVLSLLLKIGERIDRSMDVPRRLAENAKGDPEARVRLQNLLVLAREFPGNPETLAALRAACPDPSVEIRLRAAKELGAEGRGVLFELAESLVDDTINAQAVSFLGRELPFERLKTLLNQSLSWRRLQTARACLEVLGQIGSAAAVEVLVTVLEHEYGELAPVAAEALAATGSPAAEPLLIRALGRREPEELPVAAANVLGRIGSVQAVLPLKEAAERSSRDSELRRAARQAIAGIQSRLEGASPGQLSLSGAEAGQLSLAEAEAGQLSMATDPAGQLSMSGAEEELTPEPRRPE